MKRKKVSFVSHMQMPDVTLGQDETRQKLLKDLRGSLGGSRDSLRTLQAVPTPFLEPWFRETQSTGYLLNFSKVVGSG